MSNDCTTPTKSWTQPDSQLSSVDLKNKFDDLMKIASSPRGPCSNESDADDVNVSKKRFRFPVRIYIMSSKLDVERFQ